MADDPHTFGQLLRQIRERKGLRQRAVARRLHMDFAYYSRMENGVGGHQPRRKMVLRLAQALACTTGETLDLLAAAGQVAEEMQSSPALRQLFCLAVQLPTDAVIALTREAAFLSKESHER